MIRASLVVASFVMSLFSCTSLFGLANGFVVACMVAGVVAFASEGLWPARRSDPIKIEPRLSRPAQPRLETLALPAPIVRPEPAAEVGPVIENAQWSEVFSAPGVVPPATVVSMHLLARANLDMESHYSLSSETLRVLARRVTPEMLALPIPTVVRKLLEDLQAHGEPL